MNVLIPWIPSKWQEIEFSVRSTIRNYKDLDQIFIISEINPCISGTVHFYHKNIQFTGPINYMAVGKHLNEKIYTCAKKLGINEFIYQNDEQYWLKPIGDDFFKQAQPWLDNLKLEDIKGRQQSLLNMDSSSYWHWELFLIETLLVLHKNNKPFINYTSHLPTYLTIEEMEISREFFGGWQFLIDSGIFNLSNRKIASTPTVNILKKGLYTPNTDLSDIDNYYFLSHDDLGLTPKLKDFIISTFYA